MRRIINQKDYADIEAELGIDFVADLPPEERKLLKYLLECRHGISPGAAAEMPAVLKAMIYAKPATIKEIVDRARHQKTTQKSG